MTKHMQFIAPDATMIVGAPAPMAAVDDMAPPYAPLVMKKQVLQAKRSPLSGFFARLALLRHSFRRVD